MRNTTTGLFLLWFTGCEAETSGYAGLTDTVPSGVADVMTSAETTGGSDEDATSVLTDVSELPDAGQPSEDPTDAEGDADAPEPDIDVAEPPPDVAPFDAGDTESSVDAEAPIDAGTPEDTATSTDAGTPPDLVGETCEDAVDLEAVSEPTFSDYAFVVSGALGSVNDYNPLMDSGLPPACSIVYDAKGKERVYYLDLAPGEELELRMALTPATRPAGLYILDGCDPVTWPDYDGSGKCGSNEYASEGFCGPVAECDPVELRVLHDADANGIRRFYVVVDEVAGDGATGFVLYWNRIAAP